MMVHKKKALVVDDEQLILRIISDILTKDGYEVATTSSCEKALQILKQSSIDVVLTDIRMPERSGVDLLETIRSFDPQMPVILMTGFASIETAIKGVQHGAFDYLTKPLDYNKLKSVIKHAVERYDLLRENARLLKELRELNSSLELKIKERTRYLENILNSTHESIMTMDKNLLIKGTNPKTVDIFGEGLIGQKLSDFIEGINFNSIIPNMLSNPSYTTKHEIKYGSKFLGITLSPLLDFDTNKIFGIIAVTEDITEKKKLEAQLIQTAKMSAVGQLAVGIAHEFNNILSGIMGYTSFGMSRTSIEDIMKDLKIVEKASGRAADIVKKLLYFSSQKEESFQLAQLEEVIEDTLIFIEHAFASEGIKILRHYGKVPPVRMDIGEIQQVILNMAVNSKHAMPQGGVIAISTALDNGFVKFDFSDTGVGIPKENIPRIFEPFFTTKENLRGSTTSGTGLGLSVIYAIIERHGGLIDVDSEVGKGTAFSIRIPNIQRVSNQARSVSPRREESSKVEQAKRKGNILVVDDEEIICTLLEECLVSVGHNVTTVSSGEDAIEHVKRNHFDIIFLDLTLPGKDGFDVLRETKILDPNPVVVILSGRLEGDESSKAIAAGAFSFMYKPFTVNQVYSTVGQILGTV